MRGRGGGGGWIYCYFVSSLSPCPSTWWYARDSGTFYWIHFREFLASFQGLLCVFVKYFLHPTFIALVGCSLTTRFLCHFQDHFLSFYGCILFPQDLYFYPLIRVVNFLALFQVLLCVLQTISCNQIQTSLCYPIDPSRP